MRPKYDEVEFFQSRVIESLKILKISDVIISNRMDSELYDVKKKVFQEIFLEPIK